MLKNITISIMSIIILTNIFLKIAYANENNINSIKSFRVDKDIVIELLEESYNKSLNRYLIIYLNNEPVMLKKCSNKRILKEEDVIICNYKRLNI